MMESYFDLSSDSLAALLIDQVNKIIPITKKSDNLCSFSFRSGIPPIIDTVSTEKNTPILWLFLKMVPCLFQPKRCHFISS